MTTPLRHIKETVVSNHPSLKLLDGLLVACTYYTQRGYHFFWTSGEDSVHGARSLHPSGNAADLRTFHIPEPLRQGFTTGLAVALGVEYDVVLEKDHIHMEYDPKEAK